jgi:transposase
MKAYSYDLRVRIFNYSLTHSIRGTAKVFQVSPNTVYLLRCLFFETGSLDPINTATQRTRLISEEGEMFICLLINEENDLTLAELCERYEEAYGVKVSVPTMYNTLERLKITRKKKSFSDPKKDTPEAEIIKENYDEQLHKIEPSDRFYLDETSSCTNMSPLYGRSLRGEKVYDKKPTHPSSTVSTVAILSNEEGIKCRYTYTGSLTSYLFIIYLDTFVLPVLKSDHTIIMDNHPVHRSKIVQKYLNDNKIKFLYLPPYSPKLNPIEEAFSKIKNFIKKQKARTKEKLLEVIKKSFETITTTDAKGYFKHAFEFSK